MPPECPVIYSLYNKYKSGNWNQKRILSFVQDIFRHRELKNWKIDKKKLIQDLSEIKELNYHLAIEQLYLNADSTHKEVHQIGDKNPVYTMNPSKIFKIYPNAKVIHFIRDYRDQVVSIGKVDFESAHPSIIASRWLRSSQKTRKLIKQYPDQILSIHYEELVKDTKNTLEAICRHIGIDYDEGMIDKFNKKSEIDLNSQEVEKYHQSLKNPINSGSVGVYRHKLDKTSLQIAEAIAGKEGIKKGYKRETEKAGLVVHLQAFTGYIYVKVFEILWQILGTLPVKLKLFITYKLQILAPFSKKIFGK